MIKVGEKREEEIRRDLRKCGTVCPRRILDKHQVKCKRIRG